MRYTRVIIGSVPESVQGYYPGYDFFAPLEHGPGRGAKIDVPLPTGNRVGNGWVTFILLET